MCEWVVLVGGGEENVGNYKNNREVMNIPLDNKFALA